MANTILPQPWNDPYKPDPANQDLNPYIEDVYPCMTILFKPSPTQMGVEKSASSTLKKYQNVRYKGTGDKSNKKLLDVIQCEKLDRHLEKSKFFSNVDDGEEKNKQAVEKITLDNPRFLADKDAEAELEKNLNNVNSINKRVMEDEGKAEFDYNPPGANQVGIVQESNQSFVRRRDQYFLPPQPPGKQGLGAEDPTKNVDLMSHFQEIQQQALANRNSQRGGGFKTTRRR
jgi:hypothetical protein